MSGLSEIGELFGVAEGLGHLPAQPVGLRAVAAIGATGLGIATPVSLLDIVQRVNTLPVPGLRAHVSAGAWDGAAGGVPVTVSIGRTAGVALRTSIAVNETLRWSAPAGTAASAHAERFVLGPGAYVVRIARLAVTREGRVPLEVIDTVSVSAPGGRPSPGRPSITVAHRIDGGAILLQVDGRDFLPGSDVTVRLVNMVQPQYRHHHPARSDGGGRIGAALEVPPQLWLADAAGRAGVAVSACDTRTDPGSMPSGEPLWSNTVDVRVA